MAASIEKEKIPPKNALNEGDHTNSGQYDDLLILPCPSKKLGTRQSFSSTTSIDSSYCEYSDCDCFQVEKYHDLDQEEKSQRQYHEVSFNSFRLQYLLTFTAIMLADGLQGKQWYLGLELLIV